MDYIYDKIDVSLVRELAKLDDEALKLGIYVIICELTQGFKRVPAKRHKIKLAMCLIEKNVDFRRIKELTGISKTTYYKLKKEKNE